MKTTFKLAFVACLLVLSSACHAQKIVLQTIKGAVELLQETGEHPEVAIDKVTTPGGCTIKGLNTMEQGGFTSAVINGLLAGKK